MISLVKKLLDITHDDDDEKISFFCDFTTRYVLEYCNISEIPLELENTIAYIASNLYSSGHSKVSIGDMSFEFNEDFKFYKTILNKFRRV